MQFNSTVQRPPSGIGNRPGSVRGNSSYGQVAAAGVSVNTVVEVQARPAVMRDGIKGMNVGRGPGTSAGYGPERRVNDRSYYLGLLRPKVAELTAEIEHLRSQEEQINKNSTVLVQLQQKNRSLTDEITRLKSALGDINFAIEKAASASDPEQINQQAQALKTQNAENRRQVDRLFLTVKELEGQHRQQSKRLEEEIRQLEQRLQNDPRSYSEYCTARDEAYRVSDQVLSLQHEIRSQTSKQETIMASLAQDPDKKRAASLVLELIRKRQQRDDMAKQCSVSVEEERQMLMREAKSTTQDVEVLQRQTAEMRDAIQETKSRVAIATDDAAEYNNDNAKKFQELQEKDKEMQEYIDTFKEREKEELDKLQAIENTITQLLDQISRSHALKASLPEENASAALGRLRDELSEKEANLETAKDTFMRLQAQLNEKKEELSKVVLLDEKVSTELEATKIKMQEQSQATKLYADLDGLRQKVEARKRSLVARKAVLLKRRDISKQHINTLSNDAEFQKQRLQENPIYASLCSQEQKLRLLWQGVFALEEFVRSKEKETQYNNIKADCVRLVDEANTVLKGSGRGDGQTGPSVLLVGVKP